VAEIKSRHPGFCPNSQRGWQGFPGVCHCHQHLSGGSFGGRPPVADQVGSGFIGDSECSHHSRSRHTPFRSSDSG